MGNLKLHHSINNYYCLHTIIIVQRLSMSSPASQAYTCSQQTTTQPTCPIYRLTCHLINANSVHVPEHYHFMTGRGAFSRGASLQSSVALLQGEGVLPVERLPVFAWLLVEPAYLVSVERRRDAETVGLGGFRKLRAGRRRERVVNRVRCRVIVGRCASVG